KIRYLIIIDNY
ncbi:Alpha-xylosidase, partial [Haemophilus influenzae]